MVKNYHISQLMLQLLSILFFIMNFVFDWGIVMELGLIVVFIIAAAVMVKKEMANK